MAVNGQQDVNGRGKSEEVVASVLHGVKDLKIVSYMHCPRDNK
jgi:L-iditol 2-dehydrogenase